MKAATRAAFFVFGKEGQPVSQLSADEIRAIVLAFLAHEEMKKTGDYVSRGRGLASMDMNELSRGWLLAFRRWFRHRTDASNRQRNDFEAEFRLRGLPLPEHEVEHETKQLIGEIEGREDEISENLGPDMMRFLELQERPN